MREEGAGLGAEAGTVCGEAGRHVGM